MEKVAIFFESSKGKRIKNFIIGGGAAVVLAGALFKLQHWPGASLMLIIGMSVEAFIFLMQGILPPHKDYYWEKMYPGLDISPEEEHMEGHEMEMAVAANKGSVTEQLDTMLEDAKIEPEMLDRLGQNLGKLGDNIEKMSDISDAAASTSEYSSSAKAAAESLCKMRQAYSQATESVRELTEASTGTQEYREQVQKISGNLAQLNSIYELELQDTSNHLKVMNKFYGTLNSAMENIEGAQEDAMQYKQELNRLSGTLSQLNGIYGNMLSAMKQPSV